jgi:hypothetical protein
VLWTFLEYVFHRFPFHLTPHNKLEVIIGYLIHGVHHAFPEDPERLVTPLVITLPVGAVILGLLWLPLVCPRCRCLPASCTGTCLRRAPLRDPQTVAQIPARPVPPQPSPAASLRSTRTKLRCDVALLGPRLPNDAVIDASHLRINEAVGIVYFAYLAATALMVPLPGARRLLVWVVAPIAIGLELTAARGDLDWLWRDLRDWLPALVILIGYFATGAFFVKPSARLESWSRLGRPADWRRTIRAPSGRAAFVSRRRIRLVLYEDPRRLRRAVVGRRGRADGPILDVGTSGGICRVRHAALAPSSSAVGD